MPDPAMPDAAMSEAAMSEVAMSEVAMSEVAMSEVAMSEVDYQAVELGLPLDGAVRLRLSLPLGAKDSPVQPVDMSVAPGARLTLHRSWQLPADRTVQLACVQADAGHWFEGLEQVLLAAATAVVRKHGKLQSARNLELLHHGDHVEQGFRGRAGSGSTAIAAHGRHLLGFAGQPKQLVLCTVMCTGPVMASTANLPGSCERLPETLQLSGLVPPPAPGLWARFASAVAHHPQLTLLILALVSVVAVAALWKFRPRPRW